MPEKKLSKTQRSVVENKNASIGEASSSTAPILLAKLKTPLNSTL